MIPLQAFVLGFAVFLLGCAAPSFSAQVELKNGEVLVGEILDNDGRNLYFEKDNAIVSYHLSQVASIDGRPVKAVQAPPPPKKASQDKPFTIAFFEAEARPETIDISLNKVKEAYRNIPHKQTPYNAVVTGLDTRTAFVLKGLFELSDFATVARVERLRWFRSGGSLGLSSESYTELVDKVLANLKILEVPKKLRHARGLISDSIRDQKRYYEAWESAQKRGQTFKSEVGSKGWEQHPGIASSHDKLMQAYGEIMNLYKKENDKNKEAFFDHLCALDFV